MNIMYQHKFFTKCTSANEKKGDGLMGKPEGIIENYLIKLSKIHDAICWKFVSPGQRGVPDRIVIHDGQVYFIELKSETGTLSETQKLKINTLKKHKANVYVMNAKEQIDKFFKKITQKSKQQQSQWICTDNDTLQHVNQINNSEYNCIQIEEQLSGNYRVVTAYIDLNDYSIEEINDVLKAYYDSDKSHTPLQTVWNAYTKPDQDIISALKICNQIIVECIFESLDNKNIIKQDLTFKQAVKFIATYIK